MAKASTAMNKLRAGALAAIMAGMLAVLICADAHAGFADPLGGFGGPVQPYGEPMPPQPGPIPPPPGDGPIPDPVTAGDFGRAMPPASGNADPTHGNVFPAGQGSGRTIIYVHSDRSDPVTGQSRGNRMVMTIRPDSLTPEQKSQIEGILGVNGGSGEGAVNVNASEGQIEQIKNILAPYPDAQNSGGRKKINSDSPAQGYPKTQNRYDFDGPLPTVRTFSRYLVILGVVSATIFMALASTGVILGHPYAGSRVIGSAAGLMLLLMGYTIWKVVQMNTFDFNSDTPAQNQFKAGGGQVSDAYINPPDVPEVPGGGGGRPQRFGVPVEPLGNAKNPF